MLLTHPATPPAKYLATEATLPVNLLEVSNLLKRYGDRAVVDDVSFTLQQRQIVGLLGRNGAGKTTTFRMILGMVRPDAGSVVFDAQDVTRRPMYQRARLGVG